MTEANRMSVLIVDDDPAFRRLLRELLEREGCCVVGEAENGLEGIALAAALRPDLITMDLEMPRANGAEAAAAIAKGKDKPTIVIVSGSHSSEHLGAALRAGARWHVAKKDVTSQLPGVVAALTPRAEAS